MENKKPIYCEALEKDSAFKDLYKGVFDIIICEEDPCLYEQGITRNILKCQDEQTRFICPLEKAIIKS